MEVDEALGKLGITGPILHYTMIAVVRGFMACFHMLAINYIGKLEFSRCVQLCQLECGPMPNVMAALPNIGGALCSTPQSLADAT